MRGKRMFYIVMFAFVSTTRASSNIASSGYTYPYNIALIANMSPVVTAIFDRIFLRSPFPPLLWPTALFSVLGGSLIAISQSAFNDDGVGGGEGRGGGGEESNDEIRGRVSPEDNAFGCALQLLSVIFSALARILMKRTEGILTPTHIVQTNNLSNCLLPFVITMVRDPSSWGALRYLPFAPRSLFAWCTISVGIYSYASVLQIRLVRELGPGFYSSWASFRTLGTMMFMIRKRVQSSQ
ncbi:hypothetical protein ACHAW5_005432 [Stephanodiscus triporus]|uniref:WAT1-related protein n=1 Tax=Stephanodiscus triporus TaxID=2934178 RepID=A0ABD3P009_9STRA